VKSEIDKDFIELFNKLPTRIKIKARKNYKLWKENPWHPGLEFKKLKTKEIIYSIRVGIGWRALGVMKNNDTIVWFWIGSHEEYNKLISEL